MYTNDKNRFLGYKKELVQPSRCLRRNMTPQERRLWYSFLRNYEVKVYRQRVIDRFIVDFYCAKAKLVIEVDGGQHYSEDGVMHDRERTAYLQGYGLEVLRFSNSDVDRRFEAVCEQINETVKSRMK